MLTAQDLKNITQAQIEAQKELFYTKTEMDGKFSTLQTAVVAFATGTKDNADELVVANGRIATQETWIKQAGTKIGLEYKS